jgi:hypothetical protein
MGEASAAGWDWRVGGPVAQHIVEQRIRSLRVLLGLGLVSACQGEALPENERDATVDDCTAENLPSRWSVDLGYVAVETGADCPTGHDIEVEAFDCCPVMEWKGATCDYVRREADPVEGGERCVYTAVFESKDVCCGRPLLHDGRAIVAPVVRHGTWPETMTAVDVATMSPRERRRLGEDWLRSARLEHASIASFARFTLELLRYGAPPDLVADAQRAALDEVRHAELCFALASAYLGEPLGPGPLDLAEAAHLAESIGDFAEAVAREGCIGETLSAVDAAARRADATDPAVREALAIIEADESRHAVLAWRTLRWLLEREDDAALSERLAAVFATPPADPVLRDAWHRVIVPAWESLYPRFGASQRAASSSVIPFRFA